MSDIVFTVSAVTFNYDVKDAYLNASRATLESVYGPVDVGSEMGPTSKLFAVPSLKANTISTTSSSALLEVISQIDIFDEPGGELVRSYQSSQQVNWVEPPSAMALGFLTGFTLLAIAPVAIPIALRIEGNHGRDLLEEAIRDSLSNIGTQLARDQKRDEEAAKIDSCFHSASSDPLLTVLSGLVALDDVRDQTFSMLASTKKPTEQQRDAIRHWSTLVSACYVEQDDFLARWKVPAPLKALVDETKTASQNLRVLLYNGAITYGEFAQKRQQIRDAFVTAQAKIETDLAERSAEAQARAQLVAMQAQQTNLAEIQAREAKAQTLLMGVQTLNQAVAINQQQQHFREEQQQHRDLVNQLNRPRATSCHINQYNINCTTW